MDSSQRAASSSSHLAFRQVRRLRFAMTFDSDRIAGYNISIVLEELKAAYGKDYTMQVIDIGDSVQKDPWFTELGPNGRIPVLVDHDNAGIAITEGQAILQYLVRRYDPDYRFWFREEK